MLFTLFNNRIVVATPEAVWFVGHPGADRHARTHTRGAQTKHKTREHGELQTDSLLQTLWRDIYVLFHGEIQVQVADSWRTDYQF